MAQGDSIYRNSRAAAGRATLLGVYGNVGKDCVAGAVPEVTVKTQPERGALIVRGGKIKTKPTHACPNVEVPVRAVLYKGNASYVGPDAVTYEVRTPDGKVQAHTIKIDVVRAGSLPRKPTDAPTDL